MTKTLTASLREEWQGQNNPAQRIQRSSVCLIGDEVAHRDICKPRQLGEVHDVQVEEVSPSAKATHWGEDAVDLTRGHNAMIRREQAGKKR